MLVLLGFVLFIGAVLLGSVALAVKAVLYLIRRHESGGFAILRTERQSALFPNKTDNPSPPFLAKRKVPRYAVTASVDVKNASTDTGISGNVLEVSRNGCFIEISMNLSVGTPVEIVVSIGTLGSFKTDGTVIYVQNGRGAGVGFKDVVAEQLRILDAWLGQNTSRCFFHP